MMLIPVNTAFAGLGVSLLVTPSLVFAGHDWAALLPAAFVVIGFAVGALLDTRERI